MYTEIDIIINMVIEEGVRIVVTSAGNPKTWTEHLHEHGIIVAHVAVAYTHLDVYKRQRLIRLILYLPFP